ncbi:uncharacterized protein LOC142312180 isoform X2 [Anomaloglossus baeobatrachus]|uniref:uncharacterized protein LOC142312180 isoform X2 n=1 Tax=Anomaloglossus baeobatrachus TaxID=238106 RepID=UPI003F4FBE90
MDVDREKMAEKILHLTLEILFRLTGEDYTVVKKTSNERCQDPVSEGWGRPLSPITGPPTHPLIQEDINDQKILELTYKMIELLTGEVPIRCQDVTIYFSMEEWEYLEGHKDLYKDVMMEVPQPLTSPGLSSKRTKPERCPHPLLPQDCKQEDPNVPQDHQVLTISNPLSGDLLYKRILLINQSRMEMDKDKMAERILHLTLEILFRLTGEDYTVVKKTCSERCQAPVSEGWGRPLSPITGPPPHPLIHEDINDQKILELTYKMIELLTGEVPLRCRDVTIYFTMEEWEYLEGHKDLYKDVMMEVPQSLTSPDLSSQRTTPERCPRPLLPQDCKQEDPDVPQDHQGEDLTHINTTETYVRGDERCKEEISTGNHLDYCLTRSEGKLTSAICKSDSDELTDIQDIAEVSANIPDIPSSLYSNNLSSDPVKQVLSSDSLQTIKKNKSYKRGVKNQTALTAKKQFSSAEYGKCFSLKTSFVIHQKIHTEDKRFSSESGKNLNHKSEIFRALRDLHIFARNLLLKKFPNRSAEDSPFTSETEREALTILEELLCEQTKEQQGTFPTNILLRSTRFPPLSLSPPILVFTKLVTEDLRKIQTKRRFHNLTHMQRVALDQLRAMDDVVFKNVDKGGNIVIWPKILYEKEVYRQLKNTKTYSKLHSCPPSSFSHQLQGILSRSFEEGLITKKVMEGLIVTYPKIPTLYILTKIHKDPLNSLGRPIVSGIGGLCEPVCRFIDYYLKTLVETLPSNSKDTTDVLRRVDGIFVDHDNPSHCRRRISLHLHRPLPWSAGGPFLPQRYEPGQPFL